jgi:hypothetical protein
MKTKALLIGCLLAAVAVTEAHAEVLPLLSKNMLDGSITSSNTVGYKSGAENVSGVSSSIVLGTGLVGVTATGDYRAKNFKIDGGNFFAITLDAATGYTFDLSNFSFTGQQFNNGPTSLSIQYSVNGGTFTDLVTGVVTDTNPKLYSYDLINSSFQDLQSVTFRIYGLNAKSNGGQFSINDYSLSGTAVPEPQTLSLIGVGSLLMFGYMRRSRKEVDAMA